MRFKLFKNKEKIQKIREKSTGRSMVEMLGVLAIIGVLSIGGIQGYTLAMRKYRANEITNSLQKYVIIGYTGFQNKLINDSNSFELAEYNGDQSYGWKGIEYFYKPVGLEKNSRYHEYWSNASQLPSFSYSADSALNSVDPYFIGLTSNDLMVVGLHIQFKNSEKELCQMFKNAFDKDLISDGGDHYDSCTKWGMHEVGVAFVVE